VLYFIKFNLQLTVTEGNMEVKSVAKPGSLERAIAIAVQAHAGVMDKAGAPYVLHPLRVMLAVEGNAERTVAVLHDVVEDCAQWSFERLASEGFSDDVLDGLRAVTKLPEEEDAPGDTQDAKMQRYLAFVRRAASNPLGRAVKLADLSDNLDVSRLAEVTEKDALRLNKYLHARATLLKAR
jgi:(p)ppGpp synthase/HD superfamily hydrolase